MYLSARTRRVLAVVCAAGFVYLYLPLVVVASTALSRSGRFDFPPAGLTLDSFRAAARNTGAREALGRSLIVATAATGVALVLGTLLSLALHRFRFFGRDTISLLVVLPIALPGIVTALALNLAFREGGLTFGFLTLVLAHSTFCVVVAFNNVIARLRRLPGNLEEASADLGGDGFQTFRYVTFPLIRSALLAGGLLSFALSFDEIVVTTFTSGHVQTLPQWILNNTFRARNVGTVAAVATFVTLLSIIPVWIAQRVGDSAGGH
jgi:putative spermidine/putrescine transport system permease protein